MLEALYQYAKDHELIVKPGFKPKKVKYYISFSENGDFIGFDRLEDDTPLPMCPDIGSLANGTTKSNIIAEKAEVIFNLPDKEGNCKREQKQKFYLDALTEAAKYDPLFEPACKGLQKHLEAIREAFLSDKKRKPADFLSIKVDGKPLESSTGYLEWWESFRKQFDTKKSSGEMRCFITGALTEPVKTVPPVSGLSRVGGHTKGDSFICFDKDAYKSYGFEQAANAAVSESAITGVNAALADLMKDAPILAGAKHIHWFSQQTENDVTELLDLDLDLGFDRDEETADETAEQIESDEQRVRKMFRALQENALPDMPENRYYMMSLSGVNGRVMIRSYDEGTYDELCGNLRAWYKDIEIYIDGHGYKYPKLFAINRHLLKYTTDLDSLPIHKLSERIDKELSGVAPQIMYAIMHNTPLPDTVAAKALAYIRSDLYTGANDDSNKKSREPDRIACQILKAWLNRRYRNNNKEESIIMDKLNPETPSAAYQTGRLMAVYASLQNAALGDVNAGIVERYYTSACTSPALVMGKLATLAQYHLSKLKGEKPGLAQIYSKDLEEISCKIGKEMPKRFTLDQQAEFALGYYFQCAEIRARKSQSKKTEE